ncbi:hypothetical protein BU25DRAFT_400674 [Macroventuria anomochaeta]|uniref:Uncharacterized protein n=1 Tax=Macroventuria anomochaeta TaxID=301207 RepID=A0ACB6RNX7_9PLEO|nr:uncharacterized protein BU25DRAFT_400674 [Macroventuria anomochaeta]KAF2623596.1 hypothetical protein BU25DRAFT_400674 [Macroventuria anomochaeta]
MASQKPPALPMLRDEEAGVMGLTEVEPSPVDETPAEFKEGYFPSAGNGERDGQEEFGLPRTTTTTLGLGGSHGPVWWLTRLQKYSSYAFGVFTAFHIANTSLIPLAVRSVPEANRYLLLTRPYYQSTLAEPLVVALPLLAHITSGVALRLYRRSQALQRYGAETRTDKRSIPWPALSGTSLLGYILLPLASFHVWTTRILPLYMHGDNSLISLSYISHGFATHPFISFAGFTALVGTGVWHFAWGVAQWMGWKPSQVSPYSEQRDLDKKRRWYGINSVAALVASVWLAGGLGVVGRAGKTVGWIGREFDELYRYIPFMHSS